MSTIAVACPECHKELQVPAELAGKKIRCKGCGATFPIRPPAAAKPKAAAPVAAKPKATAPAKPKPQADDEEDGSAPFGFVQEDAKAVPRCPHCANELESEEAVLCLHCGYNLRTRQRCETKKVIQATAGDYFLWLLPGILAVVLILALIGFDLWFVFKIDETTRGSDYEFLAYGAVKLWLVILSLFAMFFAGKFAVKRLVFHPHPPEQERPL